MKVSLSKNSLAIFSILAGIVYLLLLVSEISEAWESGTQGFKEGMDYALREQNDNLENNFNSEAFLLKLKAKDKDNYYPDSVLNKASNYYLPARIEKMDISYRHPSSLPLWSVITMLFLMALALPVLVLLVFIPIEFYKLIFSLYKNNVFTKKNVNRIKKIGIFYIIIYVYLLAYDLYQYFLAKSVIDLEKYEIARPTLVSEILLIGLVALIFATVLNRAILMKEEQDLTI